MSIESAVPINIPQVDPMSMSLQQMMFPQMSMPSMTMTAGSYPASMFPGQRLIFFRVPSSYVNIIKAMFPLDPTSTSTISPTITATSTEPQVLSTTTPPTTMATEEITTTTTTKPTTLETDIDEVASSEELALRFKNESSDLGYVRNRNPSSSKTEKEDSALDSVLQNVMNEFSDRLINMSLIEDNNKDFNGRRRMVPTSIRKTKPISIISQVRILPIPDKMAKALLSHLRTVKQIPTARKKRVARFNFK